MTEQRGRICRPQLNSMIRRKLLFIIHNTFISQEERNMKKKILALALVGAMALTAFPAMAGEAGFVENEIFFIFYFN